jgi:hypothetical protein
MRLRLSIILAVALVPALALGASDDALARKKRQKPTAEPGITRDYDGTPMIMREEGGTRKGAEKRGDRPVRIPRGSSTYIPPPVPSPSAVPPAPLTQPPGVYRPPPIQSFGDRVTNCIHSYPLNAGIGNNPTDRQMYIRQCAN